MLAESSTAHISGDFVVFIIGVTVHNWLDVKAWWPVFTGMKRMMDELKVCNATSQLSFAESCMPGGRYIDRWRRAKGDLPDTIVHETEAMLLAECRHIRSAATWVGTATSAILWCPYSTGDPWTL